MDGAGMKDNAAAVISTRGAMIHLAGIERTFQVGDEAVYALSSVNFTVRQGEYVAIMGPSGSGKSTLLNIIGLLDRPDKGIYTPGKPGHHRVDR